jgi:polygalacturonase
MSENLIYGADITAYGAVADGATDCSDAFLKAIENGENLISVPFGNYILTKPLTFTSNTKIQLHPNATLVFDLDTDDSVVSVKDASSVIITGGNWVETGSSSAFFGFEGIVDNLFA